MLVSLLIFPDDISTGNYHESVYFSTKRLNFVNAFIITQLPKSQKKKKINMFLSDITPIFYDLRNRVYTLTGQKMSIDTSIFNMPASVNWYVKNAVYENKRNCLICFSRPKTRRRHVPRSRSSDF